MNIAVTTGTLLMPPAYEAGLANWSSADGVAGQPSYNGAANAALVPADQDFGPCLELLKTVSTQKLRWFGDTPVLPGTYLRVSAKLKQVSGAFASVRIGAYPMNAAGAKVTGLAEFGATTLLDTYGKVVEVSAIIGAGQRGGVDLGWNATVTKAHVGLDLTGPNGGVVRVDEIRVEDVTSYWVRDMMDWVDVRDYGARGDGVTNDIAAFQAADAAAQGRNVLVPAGTFYIGASLTMNAPMRFVGTLTMPASARLALTKSFDFPTYADAFGSEMEGLKRAVQALFGFTDHNVLDLKGRRVEVTEPLDVKAASPDTTTYSNRRVIAHGQLNVVPGPAWDSVTVTSQATYSTAADTQLTGVVNIANIPVGARVSGTGVGREVYVKAVNVGASSLTLSKPLYGGSGTRVFTFTRYKYVLDFSGLAQLDRFVLSDIEFLCNGVASGVMLAPAGEAFQMRDCWMNKPKDRGLTSIGRACQDLMIENCNFLSNEMTIRAQDRTSLVLNVNANDSLIRGNRVVRFGGFMVAHGSGHLITGNHWFLGDDETAGVRPAGIVFTQTNVQSAITGNYIDNSVIEWTNEHDATPIFNNEYSFGGLTISGNTCVCIDVAPWFKFLSIKPYGSGHFVHGLNVSGNVFKSLNGSIDRIEAVDTTFADLDRSRFRNILFEGNTFNGVTQLSMNPAVLRSTVATASNVWTIEGAPYLPFAGWARSVEGFVAEGAITGASGARVSEMPYVALEQGAAKSQATLNWATAAKGKVQVVLRCDTPV